MKFQYTGDPEAPQTTVIYGYRFELMGDPVEVSDPFHAKKLSGNPSFTVVKDEIQDALAESEEVEEPEPVDEETPVDVSKPRRGGRRKAQ